MRNLYALHAALWCGLWMVAGCAGPSARDFQMMQAALKAESAQAQRTITDLRAEMQGVQRDLGTARAAQARLEGELREAQRRVQEAQRALEAQREELVRTREERDRLAAISRELQAQLVELGRLRQQVGEAGRDQSRLQAIEQAIERQTKELAELKSAMQKLSTRAKQKPTSAGLAVPMYKDVSDQPAPSGESAESASRTVIVERGDTLWGLARKHRVRLSELIAVNDLTSDLIRPGQELLLPEP
ncbi:MAG: LysM peptidoglycan-binding domain-containing protein [Nitrospirae bacterium]|nr:MAG: LysM peptidoglycan-binding domain-containing protein [Nitrospirota bacterium]